MYSKPGTIERPWSVLVRREKAAAALAAVEGKEAGR
jgi:hypothetical protein